ncbi:MAG: sigma-70 family RNA polymerase sigma factor [Acidobacteriota bacterium]
MRPLADPVEKLAERIRTGDAEAISKLFPVVYDELRRLAAKYLQRERPGQTLQATALVHEAYLRLIPGRNLKWNDRAHFFAIVARSMRQILVERARARQASKRGGAAIPVTLTDEVLGRPGHPIDLLALDQALTRLAELDPKQAHLVELRFFGGLTVEETAEVMGTSAATVKRSWAFCRAWLRRELQA